MSPEDIRIRRTEASMSLADLASVMGISVRTIDRWETGLTFPNKAEIIALDTVFTEQTGAKPVSRTQRKSNTR